MTGQPQFAWPGNNPPVRRWRKGRAQAMVAAMTRHSAYMLCTAPRSGSTLLCKLLSATGVAGKPESYFYGQTVAEWAEDLGLAGADEAAVFREVIARGTRGGIFGLRQQPRSFPVLRQALATLHPGVVTDSQRIERSFGRTLFIHLSRADKVAQAVSLLKAEQTGLWHVAPDGTELERIAPHREPVYDRGLIADWVATLEGYDRAWEEWFAAEGIAPLRLTYDVLSADPAATLRQVLDALGLDPALAGGVKPGVRKLADRTSEDWVARFRAGG